MKVAVLVPESEFSPKQKERLNLLGDVVYSKSRDEYLLEELIQFCNGSTIIGLDPDNLGGFEKAPARFVPLIDGMTQLKGIALSTTAFGYIDLEYCKSRGITVTNVPHYATEAVAEHALAFLLGSAKRIFATDRKIHDGKFELMQGFELKNRTLGVIGLGAIGTRIAELGKAIGMKVIGWNRTDREIPGVEVKPLDELLETSDAVVLAVADHAETKNLLSRERIKKLKRGAVIVNVASRTIVDEEAMASALTSGEIDSYVVEGDDVTSPPLGQIEKAYVFKPFGWYTKEAMERNMETWVSNIEGIAKGMLVNPVY